MNEVIPWKHGDWIQRDIAAGELAGQTLAPGRWALQSRSTVPFVRIDIGQIGVRVVTWGDVFEVPEGQAGRVFNDSAHPGDIRLTAMGTGLGACPKRPATLTLPANFRASGEDAEAIYTSQWIDTRDARRAWLSIPDMITGVVLPYTVNQRADRRGRPFGANTLALTTGNIVIEQRLGLSANQQLALGLGADPDDTRPMTLLDAVRVIGTQLDFDAAGFEVDPGPPLVWLNAFITLEY